MIDQTTFRFRPRVSLFVCVVIGFCVANGGFSVLSGAEVDLKSLQEQKKKYGPYVGVYAGSIQQQEGKMVIEGNNFVLSDSAGGLVVGIDIGYSWKAKKWPLELGLEFEAQFLSTETNGVIDPTIDLAPLPGGTITAVNVDTNIAAFLGNGWLSLDLWRYRARLGKFVAGFRPYVGGGVGGAQIWYRNVTTSVKTLGSAPLATPFAVDEFVLAYQFFGGFEYRINNHIAAYAEYRKFVVDATAELADFENDIVVGGIKVRY